VAPEGPVIAREIAVSTPADDWRAAPAMPKMLGEPLPPALAEPDAR
jgi:hypothetical protein